MRSVPILLALASAVAAWSGGCSRPVDFPAESMPQAALAAGAARAYDTDGDGRAEWFCYADGAGRLDRIGYDRNGDGACEEIIALDALPAGRCRHLVIFLDGVSYDVARRHYDAGGLRFFHAPSRVIAPYPTMSDLCFEDLLGYTPCRAVKAKYFDRTRNRFVGGSLAYLAGRNMPYSRLMHYRLNPLAAPLFYLEPESFFREELDSAKAAFDRRESQEVLTYFGSTAGMGTRAGAEGHAACLRGLERLVNQIIFETRGLVKVTMMSDHGHGYRPVKVLDFRTRLVERGWRMTDKLERPRDAVMNTLGLTTYASFHTRDPAALAADLTTIDGVTLASFAEGDTVIVRGRRGARAVIRRTNGRYSYTPTAGDPLALKPILARLKPHARGGHEADDLLAATVTHRWPAPLQRLWRTHFALVERPPDVICSLEDHWCIGMKLIADALDAESTHGSLNYTNSATFIMSTAAALPPFMRSRDVPRHMARIFGGPWPTEK
jgi:hypothetical protein